MTNDKRVIKMARQLGAAKAADPAAQAAQLVKLLRGWAENKFAPAQGQQALKLAQALTRSTPASNPYCENIARFLPQMIKDATNYAKQEGFPPRASEVNDLAQQANTALTVIQRQAGKSAKAALSYRDWTSALNTAKQIQNRIQTTHNFNAGLLAQLDGIGFQDQVVAVYVRTLFNILKESSPYLQKLMPSVEQRFMSSLDSLIQYMEKKANETSPSRTGKAKAGNGWPGAADLMSKVQQAAQEAQRGKIDPALAIQIGQDARDSNMAGLYALAGQYAQWARRTAKNGAVVSISPDEKNMAFHFLTPIVSWLQRYESRSSKAVAAPGNVRTPMKHPAVVYAMGTVEPIETLASQAENQMEHNGRNRLLAHLITVAKDAAKDLPLVQAKAAILAVAAQAQKMKTAEDALPEEEWDTLFTLLRKMMHLFMAEKGIRMPSKAFVIKTALKMGARKAGAAKAGYQQGMKIDIRNLSKYTDAEIRGANNDINKEWRAIRNMDKDSLKELLRQYHRTSDYSDSTLFNMRADVLQIFFPPEYITAVENEAKKRKETPSDAPQHKAAARPITVVRKSKG